MKSGILAAVAAAVVATASLRASGYDSMRIMSFNICHCATHYSLSVTDEDVLAAQSPVTFDVYRSSAPFADSIPTDGIITES